MVYQNQYGCYQALHTSEEAGDAAPFVAFMLDIVAYTLGVTVRSKALPQRRVGETVSIPCLPDFSGFPDNPRGHVDEEGGIPGRAGGLTDKIPDSFTDKLTKGGKESLFAVYLHLCEHGEVNNCRAQTLTGKSADSVKKYLAKLVSAGLLQAVGSNKARVYRFADFTKQCPCAQQPDRVQLHCRKPLRRIQGGAL